MHDADFIAKVEEAGRLLEERLQQRSPTPRRCVPKQMGEAWKLLEGDGSDPTPAISVVNDDEADISDGCHHCGELVCICAGPVFSGREGASTTEGIKSLMNVEMERAGSPTLPSCALLQLGTGVPNLALLAGSIRLKQFTWAAAADYAVDPKEAAKRMARVVRCP